MKGVAEEGLAFIIHKNRGRKPEHAISDKTRDLIVGHKQSELYKGANFCHFQELLEEHEKMQVSYPTVYKFLTEAGIKIPKSHGKRKSHHRKKAPKRDVSPD